MIYQKFHGLHEHFFGWKCILCGEIIDYLILMDADSQRLSGLRDQSRAGSPIKRHLSREKSIPPVR
jgi:hypothetical protein